MKTVNFFTNVVSLRNRVVVVVCSFQPLKPFSVPFGIQSTNFINCTTKIETVVNSTINHTFWVHVLKNSYQSQNLSGQSDLEALINKVLGLKLGKEPGSGVPVAALLVGKNMQLMSWIMKCKFPCFYSLFLLLHTAFA